MSIPVLNSERYATAIARLIDVFREKDNFKNLLSTYTEESQEIENVAFDLLNGFWLSTATGVQLDAIGEIVGVARQGASDVIYRVRIRARIKLNSTSGTPNQIIELVKLARYPSPSSFVYIPEYPAAYKIFDQLGDPLTAEQIEEIVDVLRAATPAGVKFQYQYNLSPVTNLFRFSIFPSTSETSALKGFADVAQTSGGKFSGVASN